MRIDPGIEEHVREAYRGVVARDIDRVKAALAGLSSEEAGAALGLGLIVCSHVLADAFSDGPTSDDIQETAQRIAEDESGWVDIGSTQTISTFLDAVAKGDDSLGGLSRDDVIILTFVCGGDLLATHYEDGKEWWDYLDEIWADVEAQPEAP